MEETDIGTTGAQDGTGAEDFAAESLRIRTEAQRQYAWAALAKLNAIAMDGSGPAQVSALRELLDQTLGRPYAPAALPGNHSQDFHAVIERSGEELRAKLDRMDETESSGSAAPDDQSRAG